MDYYSKYQKYKMKFLNLRKQIGGAVIWQYQISPDNWKDYNTADSLFIEKNDGTFQLLPSKYMITKINKYEGYQQGMYNRRKIRRIKTETSLLARQIIESKIIESKILAQKLLETIQNFPVMLTYSEQNFDFDLVRLFSENKERINEIWGQPDSFETEPRNKSSLFREIKNGGIRLRGMNHIALLAFIQGIIDKRVIDTEQEKREREEASSKKEEEDKKWEGVR
jgi:hypothetical protein